MRFAICTSIYEAGRPFLSDWIDAAITATKGHDVCGLVAVDDFFDAKGACKRLTDTMSVDFSHAPKKATLASVRETMITAAVRGTSDAIVFCDMDDRLSPNSLTKHAEALNDADFSYGDLQPIDTAGSTLGDTFFGKIDIPNRTNETQQIVDRNWLGFSNTAVIRDKVPPSVCNIPAAIVAVDWWFYTQLLKNGLTGARADGVVAEYRVHTENQLGPYAAADIQGIKRRCEIVKSHHKALLPDPVAQKMVVDIENFMTLLEKKPEAFEPDIEKIQRQSRLWHEDICFLAAQSSAENNHSKK